MAHRHRIDDESFLADLNGFLQEYDVPQLSAELQSSAPAVKSGTGWLQDDQLFAETATLLASYNDNASIAQLVTGPRLTHNVTKEVKKTLSDQRRVIKNAQAAKRRLKYRKKLKNERETLYEQEKTLADELNQLQHARKKVKSIQETSVTAPLWKAVASRQMDGRLVAQEQQQRLKNAVSSRAKVLQEVNEMMLRRICASNLRGQAERPNTVELEPDDIALFEEYLQDMDDVYKQTDETFRAAGVDENPSASYKVGPLWKRDGDLEYFENLEVTLVPFSFERTSNATWQAIQHVHRDESRQHYNGVTDPENTIAVKCRIPSPKDDGGLVDMLIQVAIKKYVEADRMIIVWRALTEGDDEFAGMHSDETGWSVIRPHKPEGAVIQTFTHFFPMAIATTFGDKARTDQFSKLVVTSGEEDGLEITRMMESLLIQDSVS
ncbi:hypothetical protein V7S43_004110 [Phytophthora oleae]|uniref:BZIP domain-containing protein n=1 Tax=Phytophthora oleae TaxID=2107226 RepID=A0ABD3FZ34_9STRA